jgi:hypothetical protein
MLKLVVALPIVLSALWALPTRNRRLWWSMRVRSRVIIASAMLLWVILGGFLYQAGVR